MCLFFNVGFVPLYLLIVFPYNSSLSKLDKIPNVLDATLNFMPSSIIAFRAFFKVLYVHNPIFDLCAFRILLSPAILYQNQTPLPHTPYALALTPYVLCARGCAHCRSPRVPSMFCLHLIALPQSAKSDEAAGTIYVATLRHLEEGC